MKATPEKLLEHCYQDNLTVLTVDKLLRKDGLWWKQPFVWAGFYADADPCLFVPDEDKEITGNTMKPANLYDYARAHGVQVPLLPSPVISETDCCRYVVNHTKQQFVDISTIPADIYGNKIHPLCLLTAEGNGRGGGDYKRRSDFSGLLTDYHLVGIWARDQISVQDTEPTHDFKELKVRFYYE